MRRVLSYLVIAGAFSVGALAAGAVGLVSPAAAQPAAAPAAIDSRPERPAETREQRLDRLFSELKQERNERAAARTAEAIRSEWLRSGSATVDLLMQRASTAIQSKKYAAAQDFLDEVTVLAPDFAEGWNRRASLHYLMRDYARSMLDAERALRLEPRHFGALAGMGAIFREYDNKRAALDAYQRVLAIYPMLRNAQKQVADLADDLAGQGI